MPSRAAANTYYDFCGKLLRGTNAEDQAVYKIQVINSMYVAYKRDLKSGEFIWKQRGSMASASNWVRKDAEKSTIQKEAIDASLTEFNATLSSRIERKLLESKEVLEKSTLEQSTTNATTTTTATTGAVVKKKRGRPSKAEREAREALKVLEELKAPVKAKEDARNQQALERAKQTEQAKQEQAKQEQAKQEQAKQEQAKQEQTEVSTESTPEHREDIATEPVDTQLSVEEKSTSTPKYVETNSGGNVMAVAKLIHSRIKSHIGLNITETADWVMLCLARNRKSKREHIINTRLTDIAGQPIYILDREALTDNQIGDSGLSIVDTLYQAKAIFSECNCDKLPEPLQWADDCRDLIWDPTKKVIPISSDTIKHIFEERLHRFPDNLKHMPLKALIQQFRLEMENEGEKAARDCAYAIPCYSSTYNKVGMMLPVHIMTDTSDIPEVVMCFNSKYSGYELYTIVTPEEAYRAAKMFRSPDTTWLKGVQKK